MAYNLLNCFPYVLQGDCTYKTNVYGLALLQILGFTSTGKNFTVAYALLQHERIENYSWALRQLRGLFQGGKLPGIMYTDRDLAFIRAVELILPETSHHLCRRHIEVNVRARALAASTNAEFANGYMRRFNFAISAPTHDEWTRRWRRVENRYSPYPDLLEYTLSTWIRPYPTKILSMHTDFRLHFGTHTTNR